MKNQSHSSPVTSHCFRLIPGQDLKKELQHYCQLHTLQAACVISSVGSLKKATLRLSGGKDIVEFSGPFEIVSLNGTLGVDGIHLHISLSNNEGQVIGGHLMDGSEIYTTAEIILLENTALCFSRETDVVTGYKELMIKKREI
ncbi:MAG: PPC domain-containing DNA-binding protein [Pseudobdellovibrionaceae bacterium]